MILKIFKAQKTLISLSFRGSEFIFLYLHILSGMSFALNIGKGKSYSYKNIIKEAN